MTLIAHLAPSRRPPPGRSAVAIRLANVTRLFDSLAAISQVTVEVATGETVWLRGPNGSGKSTLLRIIATAISPTYGRGAVLGHDLAGERPAIRAQTDLVGHRSRLYDDLTAAENLRFACELYGVGSRRTNELLIAGTLERVGLQQVAAVRTGSFSQGMRQRLALARCLIRAPRLILLDEPYAGLDVEARTVVDDLLADARRNDRTVALASHEAPPAHLIDRAITMDVGRVIAADQRQ